MKSELNFGVIGGDTRLAYAANRLTERGCSVCAAGLELLESVPFAFRTTDLYTALRAQNLLFGLPFTKTGDTLYAPFSKEPIPLHTVYGTLGAGQTVFAGMLTPAAAAALAGTGCAVTDYYKDEPFTLYNAMLTAEAVTGLLLRHVPVSLFGAEIAVLGYGRIGFYLARMLQQLGARVTVFARSELQRAKARTIGLQALPLSDLTEHTHFFHALVNTVPAPVITKKALDRLNADCCLIETASAPYGIPAGLAAQHGNPYILAAGLPGKYAPASAGKCIADTVLRLYTGGDTICKN